MFCKARRNDAGCYGELAKRLKTRPNTIIKWRDRFVSKQLEELEDQARPGAPRQLHFHFTPTSASWLNQVEIWFGILSRKALRGGSISSIADLRNAIEAFVAK
ncbi:hypothetical protein F6R98_13250 [Candidatus Methylospira mobilis]|uniref:Tc1-like transposase DDE domain-containing protein n=1 Tax=Candidatus Methylospira mobilis TaxID=1808979 RepID=A0A5Q0BML6_9GAMM|nr:hypothetical protein F6R98_13250 [Candidatus Methylospira mobilis]